MLFEDRTRAHADHIGQGFERQTTAAVGVLKAVHCGEWYILITAILMKCFLGFKIWGSFSVILFTGAVLFSHVRPIFISQGN